MPIGGSRSWLTIVPEFAIEPGGLKLIATPPSFPAPAVHHPTVVPGAGVVVGAAVVGAAVVGAAVVCAAVVVPLVVMAGEAAACAGTITDLTTGLTQPSGKPSAASEPPASAICRMRLRSVVIR